MQGKPRPLAQRVVEAAETTLAVEGVVSPLDMLMGIRWLDPGGVDRWRQGRVDSIESLIQTNPARLAEALELFRSWATGKGLIAGEAQYVARTPQRQTLRFSRSGDPAVEQGYRTHWMSPQLSEARQARVTEKASRPPELVVIDPLDRDWTCHRCGGSGERGGLLIMEEAGPACLRCAGLDDLEYLPAGDALLTRRAKAKSARHAVVVRFSRSRKRYERRGILVEAEALREAEASVGRE